MFVYQPTNDTLELRKDKGTDYLIGWKSKEVYTSKITSLYTVFLHNTKFSVYKIRVQFNNNVLVIEQNNFAAKIVNTYIVYDLDDLPKISL